MNRKKKIAIITTILFFAVAIFFVLNVREKTKMANFSQDKVAEETDVDLIDKYRTQLPELAEKAKSGNTDDLHEYAVAQYATGDPVGAEKTYRAQIAKGGDDAEVHNKLANALRDQQKFAEAAVEYEIAIAKDKKLLKAYYNLGSMYQNMMDDGERAIETYKKGIENNPKSADMFFYLGVAYEKTGDMKNAKESYASALGINGNNIAAKTALERLEK